MVCWRCRSWGKWWIVANIHPHGIVMADSRQSMVICNDSASKILKYLFLFLREDGTFTAKELHNREKCYFACLVNLPFWRSVSLSPADIWRFRELNKQSSFKINHDVMTQNMASRMPAVLRTWKSNWIKQVCVSLWKEETQESTLSMFSM